MFYNGFASLMESPKFDISTEITVKFENPKEKWLLGYSILTHNNREEQSNKRRFSDKLAVPKRTAGFCIFRKMIEIRRNNYVCE